MGFLGALFTRRTLSLSLLTPHPLKTPRRPTTSRPAPPKNPSGDKEEEQTTTESITELKNDQQQLQQEIKTFKDNTKRVILKTEKKKKNKISLFAAFTDKQSELKPKEPTLVAAKKLSPDVEAFAQYLFEKGYFNDANFARGRKNFDPGWFSNVFTVGYVKFAALKFARDHREIAKWLSGSALKQVAVFGCPYPHRGGVFPAKRLRKFFEVPENTVCSGCALQQSCKFGNQSVWKCNDANNLDFVTVMKVITPYALESVNPQLVVPDEVKKSVSQLLKEVVKLSQIT